MTITKKDGYMWVKIGRLLLFSCFIFGEEKVIDSPKIITPEWEERVFGVKQGIQNVTGSLHEMIDGLISEHFGADFFASVEEAVRKQPTGEGVYTEFWPNGIKRAHIFIFCMSANDFSSCLFKKIALFCK